MTTLNDLFKPATKPTAPSLEKVLEVAITPAANPFTALQQTLAGASSTPAYTPPPTTAESVEQTLASEFNFTDQPEAFTEEATNNMRQMFMVLQKSLGGDKVSDNLNRILTHLHNHPFLRDVLQPDDIHAIAKAVQASNGLTIQKKMERKGKRAANQEEVDAMASMMGNMNFVGPGGS